MRFGSLFSSSMTPNWLASEIGCRIAATVTPAPDSRWASTIWLKSMRYTWSAPTTTTMSGFLVAEQVEALQNRVGRAAEPSLAEPLLGRHRRDIGVQHPGEPPGLGDAAVEAVGLVLGQHHDLAKAGVQQVAQREVEETVAAAERDGGLRAVRGERHQALSLTAGENDAEDLGGRHGAGVGESPRRRLASLQCV